jgi:asparagine synthase (glutamine-hydrolysing)
MCGIVGIFDSLGASAVQEFDIRAMCDAIVHRGPNDYGYHVENHVGLGMRRLSIIDVDGGRQPITNENDSIWIVFNGEIYNYIALRDMLLKKGHQFKTKTDTETIIHLYEEYGVRCLDHLQGMFTFMIWDAPKNRIFVARDRLGIKPCFWTQVGSRVAIASEMKSLLKLPWLKPEMDWNGFDAFFAYTYIPAPLTIYKGIHKLSPAHYLLVENGNLQVKRYWDVSFADKHERREADLIEEFLHLLQESVNMRLMSEVPLGAFLSGGIDSGLITALMSSSMSKPANTFNISFGDNKGSFLDEGPYAREIAKRYGCVHREVEVSPRIDEAIDAAVFAFDEPFADDSLIPTYHICDVAKEDVIVVLTGLGGDENFAGYERYLGFWLSRFFGKVPRIMWDYGIAPLVGLLKEQKGGHYQINHLKRFVAGGGLPPGKRYQSYIRTLSPELRRELYLPEISSKIDFDYVEGLGSIHFERLEDGDFLDRALYQDLCMYLPDDILALSDRIGMHHSLELRVPFVDHKLVEFCARIPSKLKLNRGEKKYLLKKVASKFLPDSVVSHRKQGFCTPMASWLRSDLRSVVDSELSREKILNGDIFNQRFIANRLSSHNNRQELNDKLIFSLLVFQKWFNRDKKARMFRS